MSNRLLALFILVVTLGGIFGAYWYFFVANVGSIELSVGKLSDVTVEVMTPFGYKNAVACSETCQIDRVPPVDIILTARKSGYTDASINFKLTRGQQKKITLQLDKKVTLEQKDPDATEKIEIIKLKKHISNETQSGSIRVLGMYAGAAYAYLQSDRFSLFTYDENGEKKEIATIPELFSVVSWNPFDGIIILKTSDGKTGFFEIDSGIYTPLTKLSSAEYVKKGPRQNLLSIRTGDGVYSFDKDTNELMKDGMYDDSLVIAPGKILGLLRASSSEKMSLLNLPVDGKTKIILQDIRTHERKVIYTSEANIVGLIMNNGKIIALDASGVRNEVKNLEL